MLLSVEFVSLPCKHLLRSNLMPVELEAPQENLSEVVSFRITATEKAAIRLIAAARGGMSESEVVRVFFDSGALRAEGERLLDKLVA